MFCQSCGTKLRPGAQYCHQCGHPVPAADYHFDDRHLGDTSEFPLLSDELIEVDRDLIALEEEASSNKRSSNSTVHKPIELQASKPATDGLNTESNEGSEPTESSQSKQDLAGDKPEAAKQNKLLALRKNIQKKLLVAKKRRLLKKKNKEYNKAQTATLKQQSKDFASPEEKRQRQRKLLIACIAVCSSILVIAGICFAALMILNRGTLKINPESFPDPAFMEAVRGFDLDNNGALSETEIQSALELDCSSSSIQDLSGIELFYNLQKLNCSNNGLKYLDLSQNKELKQLNCSNNPLISLQLQTNSKLEELICTSCGLKSLDLKGLELLTTLDASQNELTSIDLSTLLALNSLNISNNQLEVLDISKNQELQMLDARNNKLSSLDLSSNKKVQQALYDESVRLVISLEDSTSLDPGLIEALASYDDGDKRLSPEEQDAINSLELKDQSIQKMNSIHLIQQFSKLSELKLINCDFSALEESKLRLEGLASLSQLDIEGSKLASLELVGLDALKELSVKDCSSLVSLSLDQTDHIHKLNLRGSALKDVDIKNLKHELEELYLDEDMNIDGALVKTKADFPDDNLRSLLFDKSYNKNQDDMLSSAEIEAITKLNLSGKKIHDARGVRSLKQLTELNLSGNQLSSLSLNGLSKLKSVQISSCGLTELNAEGLSSLERLDCSQNSLTSLNLSSSPKLSLINATRNKLTTIKVHASAPLSLGNFSVFADPGVKLSKS